MADANSRCPDCGQPRDAGASECRACGHEFLRPLTLVAAATGRSRVFRIATNVGRSLFEKGFGDPEARFASDPQFRLAPRDGDGSGWMLEPAPDTVNPTFLDGRPVKAPVPLADGSAITIGGEKMKLLARI